MALIAAVLLVALASSVVTPPQQASKRIFQPKFVHRDFAFGADLSWLKEAEDKGRKFKENGKEMPGLQIFKNHGYNWIRLRLFVEPVKEGLPNNLEYTITLAKSAKALGYKFLLDYHYSQSWADPAKQPTPEAWLGLTHQERTEKVFEYTRDTIARFKAEGVLPEMVQIGNEIRVGMLWPDGKLPGNWDNLADYIYAGINGMDAGRGNGQRPKVMIHFDEGANQGGAKWFYDHIEEYGIPYDIIGFSYYPWWHGPITKLKSTMNYCAKAYEKDVILVETAYHYRTNGETRNQLIPFPETPEGQRDFYAEVTRAVMDIPGGRGKGIFWWEPAWPNPGATRGMFDRDDNVLPVITVFDKFALGG